MPCAKCAAGCARLLRLHRLHRAGRHGHRRRRLGRRLASARGWRARAAPCSAVMPPSALIQREAKPDEVAYLAIARTRSRWPPLCAPWPARRRAADLGAGRAESRRQHLSDARQTATLAPSMPVPDLLAERDGAFGAADRRDAAGAAGTSSSATRVTIGSAHVRDPQRGLDAEPDKLSGGVGFGAALPDQRGCACAPRKCCSPAVSCAGPTAFGCRTTLPPTATAPTILR